MEATEDDALEMANDVLRSDKLCQLEELNEARKAVKTLSKTRQVLAKYRAEHPSIKHAEVRTSISPLRFLVNCGN